MINNKEQKKLISLYNAGFSASQVAYKLNMSISGINYYLQKYNVKKRNISNSIILINQTKFGKKPFILKTKLNPRDKKLKTAGTMLYWAEGSKTIGEVAFANSDPKMIELFLVFLRRICGVAENRLRVQIHAYEDHDTNKLLLYWSRITHIPITQFHKVYIHTKKQGTYKKISEYGTVSVRYSDKRLIVIILNWIKDEAKYLNH